MHFKIIQTQTISNQVQFNKQHKPLQMYHSNFIIFSSYFSTKIIFLIYFILSPHANSQSPKNCTTSNCVQMSYYKCNICYDNCSSTQFGSSQQFMVFKSCAFTYCVARKNSVCIRYQTDLLNQGLCIQKCCGGASYNVFTYQTLNQCAEKNNLLKSQWEKARIKDTIIITCSIIGSIIGLILIIFGLCYLYDYRLYQKFLRQVAARNNSSKKQFQKIELIIELDQFEKQKNKEREIQICSICLQEGTDCITFCEHHFHSECLCQWLSRRYMCPLCTSPKLSPVIMICLGCHKKSTKGYFRPKQTKNKINTDKQKDKKQLCNQCLTKGQNIGKCVQFQSQGILFDKIDI